MKITLEIKSIEKDGQYLNTSYRIKSEDEVIISDNHCSINEQEFRLWHHVKYGSQLPEKSDIVLEYPSEVTDYMYSLLNIKYIGMYWEQQKFISELKHDIHNIIHQDNTESLLAEKKPMQKARGEDKKDSGLNREAI